MESNQFLLTPQVWETRDEQMNQDVRDCDDTVSEYDGSLQPNQLVRYPSLAELTTIATNCESACAVSETLPKKVRTSMPAPKAEDCRYQVTSPWNQDVPATPPKADNSTKMSSNQSGDDPLTPTANLKMLVSAASPIIRDRETKKRELFPGQNSNTFEALHAAALDSLVSNSNRTYTLENESCSNENSLPVGSGENKITVSRKDKSLGLLCQKFLSKYPEYPKVNEFIEIGLDDVARDLSVERRRIYDIVNVLESVEVISRYAKNRYVWHGKSRLPNTLIKLRNYAKVQGFKLKSSIGEKETNSKDKENKKEKAKKNQIAHLSAKWPLILPKNPNTSNQLARSFTVQDQNLMPPPSTLENKSNTSNSKRTKCKDTINDYCRKDKSLGVLSQKFLMLFLVAETGYVTLEDAANVLIGEEEEGQTKYKTKVRRLYDIANILSSLQLIEKVHIHSIQSGRKPGFRWIGIDPNKLELVAYTQEKIQNSPAAKRLCAKNSDGEESAVGRLIKRRPSQQQIRARSEDSDTKKCKLPRSRSERILGTKSKAFFENEDDGFSVHEITNSFGADPSSGSPTEAKFRAELQKLHQQYPNRMSQLLSACRQSDDFEAKKSRRSLFVPVKTEPDGSPLPKRRRSADDVLSTKHDVNGGFSHSISSPFKSIHDEDNELTQRSPVQAASDGNQNLSSPEQKILLERKKQQQLLDEQRGFHSQDERWKRIERELDKAFPKAGPSRPMMVHQSSSPLPYDALVEQASVAIQASLIDDISPLKPLSFYRKLKKPWQNSDYTQSSGEASATPSPVHFQSGSTGNSFPNPHALSPIPILPATERPPSQMSNSCSGNTVFLHVPNQASTGSPIVWATPTPPSGNSTPSPDQLIRVTAPPVSTALLYSPRSLTSTPEPGHLDSCQASSTAETQHTVAASPLVTSGDSQVVVIKNRIPVQQALSIQVLPRVSNPEMFTRTPGVAQLKVATPLVKFVDLNRAVSMETPTSSNTIQLLSDVSKRLSLPLTNSSTS